jgi:hypothetical protein
MEKMQGGGGRVQCGSLQECTTAGGELCREALRADPDDVSSFARAGMLRA